MTLDVLVNAGPWLPVPPEGYGGIETVVADGPLTEALAGCDAYAVVVQTPGASGRLADTAELAALAASLGEALGITDFPAPPLDALGPDVGATEEGTRPNWGGVTQFGALYQLTEERGALPTVGVIGRLRLLYGPSRPAREAEVVALVGKTVIGGQRPLGVHLNLGSAVRLDPLPGERLNRYLVNVSIGQTISHDTALVVAYVREQQERGDPDYSLVQAGVRQRLPDWGTTFGLALGVGTNRGSPRAQVAFAFQWEFGGGGR